MVRKKGELPKYSQTFDYLKSRCQILENCEAVVRPANPKEKPKQPACVRGTALENILPIRRVIKCKRRNHTLLMEHPAMIPSLPPVPVLVLTAVVQAFDKKNRPHPCRVLLACGSQVNFVPEELTNRLGLPKQPTNVPITGINALRTLTRDKITLKIKSRVSSFQVSLECLVTLRVTGTIPSSKIDIAHWEIPNGVVLADPKFHTPDEVDLLIGVEIFIDVLKLNQADNLPPIR